MEEHKDCCSLRGTTAGEYGVGDHVDQQKWFLANNEEDRAWIGEGEAYSSKFQRHCRQFRGVRFSSLGQTQSRDDQLVARACVCVGGRGRNMEIGRGVVWKSEFMNKICPDHDHDHYGYGSFSLKFYPGEIRHSGPKSEAFHGCKV